MKNIPLGGSYGRAGFMALVDDDMFDEIVRHHWCVTRSSSGTLYATRSVFKPGRPHYMHHHVLRLRPGLDVDHINGNGLDNRRENLRYATHAENLMNARLATVSQSGFRGVRKRGDRFLAIVQARNSFGNITVGTYDSAEKAAAAYDAKVTELFGEFAWTNVKSGLLDASVKSGQPRTRDHHLRHVGARPWASSGYKGVYPVSKQSSKWQAKIQVKGRSRHLGVFDTPEEAARAYNDAAFEAWGERAHLNKV